MLKVSDELADRQAANLDALISAGKGRQDIQCWPETIRDILADRATLLALCRDVEWHLVAGVASEETIALVTRLREVTA